MQVSIIDFGLAKKYRDPKTHIHIPYRCPFSSAGAAVCRAQTQLLNCTSVPLLDCAHATADVQSLLMLQREQKPDGHSAVCQHQHAPGHRAEPARRHRVAGLRGDVFPAWQPAVAGAQGRYKEAEVREDQREEDEHADRGVQIYLNMS